MANRHRRDEQLLAWVAAGCFVGILIHGAASDKQAKRRVDKAATHV